MTGFPPIGTLPIFQDAMRGCRRCVDAGFLPEAHPVFRGQADQRRMLVGQAPGANAHLLDVPWSGSSGALLRRWFAVAGFDPDAFFDDWYLTSLTKCFPGKASSGSGDRAPSAAERALCRPWLDGELSFVQPRLIVTVGRMAADALIPGARQLSLTALVGSLYRVEFNYGTVPVIPLPHPSGVGRWLNDPANRALVEHGLDHLAFIERTLHHE